MKPATNIIIQIAKAARLNGDEVVDIKAYKADSNATRLYGLVSEVILHSGHKIEIYNDRELTTYINGESFTAYDPLEIFEVI